jgi:hypothetical protein
MPFKRVCGSLAFGFAVMFAGAAAADRETQTFVPWRVLNTPRDAVTGIFILYWIPASREEMRRSPLLTSHALSVYAGQCIGMQIIRPDDASRIESLRGEAAPPFAALADSEGSVIERVEGEAGGVRVPSVEKMVHDEVGGRGREADRMLDLAEEREGAGDRDAAIVLYRRVCTLRCLFPRKARDAERALRRLGTRCVP